MVALDVKTSFILVVGKIVRSEIAIKIVDPVTAAVQEMSESDWMDAALADARSHGLPDYVVPYTDPDDQVGA